MNVLLAASMGLRMVQGPVGSLIGVLKAVSETVHPHHLCYTPFSALYTQQSKVPPLPLPPLAAPPNITAAAAPLQQQPSAASPLPGTPQQQLPDDHDMFWSILRRPQGELRQVDNSEDCCQLRQLTRQGAEAVLKGLWAAQLQGTEWWQWGRCWAAEVE